MRDAPAHRAAPGGVQGKGGRLPNVGPGNYGRCFSIRLSASGGEHRGEHHALIDQGSRHGRFVIHRTYLLYNGWGWWFQGWGRESRNQIADSRKQERQGDREQETGNCLGVDGSTARSSYLFPVPCLLSRFPSLPSPPRQFTAFCFLPSAFFPPTLPRTTRIPGRSSSRRFAGGGILPSSGTWCSCSLVSPGRTCARGRRGQGRASGRSGRRQ